MPKLNFDEHDPDGFLLPKNRMLSCAVFVKREVVHFVIGCKDGLLEYERQNPDKDMGVPYFQPDDDDFFPARNVLVKQVRDGAPFVVMPNEKPYSLGRK